MFKLQVAMKQAEDQRLRLLRETGWRVVTCSKEQQAELTLLCSLQFTQELSQHWDFQIKYRGTRWTWESRDKEVQCIARKCRMWEIQC